LLLRLAPGDAASVLAGEAGSATPEYMAQLRQRFGLDQPVLVQLALYMKNMVALDLGFSFRYNMPVLTLILHRLGPTPLLLGCDLRPARRRRRRARHPRGPPRRQLAGHAHLDPRPRLLRDPALLDRPDARRDLLAQARLAADQRHGDRRRLP